MRAYLVWTVVLAGVACREHAEAPPPPSKPAPRAFTLAYPTTWLAKKIAGDALRIVDVRPDHDDPEHWSPTNENVFTIQEGAPVLLVGGGYERWYRATDYSVFLTKTLVDELGPGAIRRRSGTIDPYFWFEPEALALASQHVADQFSAFVPDGTPGFRQRQAALAKVLTQLEGELRARSQGLPPLFAARDGYAYAARALGWKIQTLAVDPSVPPSMDDLRRWDERKRVHPAPFILFNREPSAPVVAGLAKVGLRPVLFPLLGKLPDAERDAGRDLIDVYRASVERLAKAAAAPR